jgi:bis(5'-nucleosidyl)-tetraphosphatase
MAVQERSAGFILYIIRPGDGPALSRAEYLLLDYGKHWDFAKGHVEAGEDDLTAATRELAEETDITAPRVVPGFAHELTYFFRQKSKGLIRKTVVFFLARSPSDAVRLSHEHSGHAFLPFDAAVKRATFASAKQVLRLAQEHLEQHPDAVTET